MISVTKPFIDRLGPLLTVSENWGAVQRALEARSLARVQAGESSSVEEYAIATSTKNGKNEYFKIDDEFYASVNSGMSEQDQYFAFIGEDWFRMCWMISGAGRQELVPHGMNRVPSWITPNLLAVTPGYIDFELQPDSYIKVEGFKGEVLFKWVSVAMSRRALQRLLSDVDSHIPAELDGYLSRDASVLMMHKAAISPASMSIVASLFEVPLSGQMRIKYVQSQIHSLVFLALGHNWDPASIGAHDVTLRRRIMEAAAILRIRARSASFEVQDLPRQVGLSRSHFANRFIAMYGMPPGRYLLDEKLKYAAELLISREIPIKEIAQLLGYSRKDAFSRAFSMWYKTPPSRFREQHRRLPHFD